MTPLDLVNLTELMQLTTGDPNISIGLIDGPVAQQQSDFTDKNIRETSAERSSNCSQASSSACTHGTFIAGILCANRTSAAPAICPNCTLLVHSIFVETVGGSDQMPSATPEALAAAIVESIDAGARILNLSVALLQPSSKSEQVLEEALGYALQRGVLTVVAAGNQGTLGSSAITRHPWVIPVVACDLQGHPIYYSNLASSIGRRGLRAPGENITSLGSEGQPLVLGGTSVAVPFVTGAIALLWSIFPTAKAAEIKFAITQAVASKRTTVVPPLLNAWAAYQRMASILV